tara:strand:+ start:152 stop:625 length:474 start_codon:yes stop_codon:yes gene_type:complete
MIYVKDNTLTEEEIKKLLVFTTHPQNIWDQTFTINIHNDHDLIQKVKNHVISDLTVEGHNNKFDEVEWCQVITYPTGSSKMFHFDKARDSTTGASITFLNDNFVGGQAIVEGIEITPIVGRTYYFDGRMYKHGVLNIIKGIRYTLSIWYTNEKRKNF